MSDSQQGPSSSSEPEKKALSSPQAIPTGSSGAPHYFTDPIQFRVRGTSITGASPPKFVSLEEVMKAAVCFENMSLAHEIAVDNDFKLEPFEPPDNSYQKLVKETMHRAYFDILREQLNSDPPSYKQALVLLEDVKKGLYSILLPRHTRIKEVIDEVLDSDFIKQQAENNSLDFGKYATFVVDLMAKLAAPARDEMIENIRKLEDTVETFRTILETLEVLKLDMANTLIAMIRPHVQRESVQYEREKFDQILKVSEDGLKHTREWLIRNIDKTGISLPVTDVNIVRNVTAQTLSKAYIELLNWDDSKEYPETVQLDAPRFAELGTQVYRVVCAASTLLAGPSCTAVTKAADLELKTSLKSKLLIILDGVATDTQLSEVLPSVAEEVIASTDQLLERFEQRPMAPEVKELIRNHLTALRDPEHRVRQIVRERVLEFLKGILVCGGGTAQVPIGLSIFSEELTAIAGTLLRYVMHNKAVFTKHYMDIIEEELKRS